MTRVDVDGHRIEISNPDKVFYPDAGITKGRVVDYYLRIAGVMVDHLRGRPLVMHRFPDGIEGTGFLQKQAPDHLPDWVTTAEMAKQGGVVRHVVVDRAATLVYLADLGCLSFHVWPARADRPRHLDQLVFDLDPADGDVAGVVFGARRLRELFDELGLAAYVKSSGSRGVHVHVPVAGGVEVDRARRFSQAVGDHLARCHPDRLTTAQRKSDRKGRVFVDTLRNAYAQHAVAAYSLRARPGAPVAVPVDWHEATRADFDPRRITVANVFRRLAHKEDPWADLSPSSTSLADAEARLDARRR